MRDLLGIAVAILVGLVTLAFQPWTPQWWAGIVISASVALVTASHIVWQSLPDTLKKRHGDKVRSTAGILILVVIFVGGFVASHFGHAPKYARPSSDFLVAFAPEYRITPVLGRKRWKPNS